MLYRTMPRTKDPLSILGFGCMRLPQKGRSIDEPAALNLIDMAIEKGVTYFDTAVPYHMGASEPFLGLALARDGKRSKVRIATKLPHWQTRSVREMDAMLASQLANLRTDVIDYYLIHSLNGATWLKARESGVLEFLERAKRDGRIRFAGFSYHGSREEFPPIVDAWNWDFCQIQYNLLDEQNQAGRAGLEYAASKGLGVIIMEPLRGGNLARKPPVEIQAVWDKAPVKRTPAEWALRWVWNHPEVSVALSGLNRLDHLEENCRVAEDALPGALADSDLDLIAKVREQFREGYRVPCTACAYCMPCPQGVNIPGVFNIYNNFHLFGDKMWARAMYNTIMPETERAPNCVECGECEAACPQGIAIIEGLKDSDRVLTSITLP